MSGWAAPEAGRWRAVSFEDVPERVRDLLPDVPTALRVAVDNGRTFIFLTPFHAGAIAPAAVIAPAGPSAMECIAAAMRADPSLTLEQAIGEVGISAESLERYGRAAEERWLAEFGPTTEGRQ